MSRQLKASPFYLCVLASLFAFGGAHAQGRRGGDGPAVITQRIDERNRVTLQGSTRHEVDSDNDRGDVDDALPMQHMLLQLRRSPEQESALQGFIDELHTEGSPNFHRWMTAQQFGESYGLSSQDLETITGCLHTSRLLRSACSASLS